MNVVGICIATLSLRCKYICIDVLVDIALVCVQKEYALQFCVQYNESSRHLQRDIICTMADMGQFINSMSPWKLLHNS